MSDILKDIEAARDTLKNISRKHSINNGATEKIERERNDLFHLAELGKFNAAEGFKHFKRLGELSRERRECKDENDILSPFMKMSNDNKYTINELNHAIGLARNVVKKNEARTYRLRERLDLEDRF
ncbi:MAG: hypothetical protein WD512_08275 [Candidatus Paceibacterota bacterium]